MSDIWFKLYLQRDARCLDYAQAYGFLTSTVRALARGDITPDEALRDIVTCDTTIKAASGAKLPAPLNPVPAFEAGRDGWEDGA